MKSYFVGIDIGTGSTKAIAMNEEGEVIHTAQVSYPSLHPQPSWHEQAPEQIWQAFVKAVARITDHFRHPPDAVALSSAMHSVIPVNAHGVALRNMIIWADNRSAAEATKIHQSSAALMLYEQTGTPIHAMSPLAKIRWLRTHEPAIFHAAERFISIKEYIWFRLFRCFEVDYSIASATGLMDIEALTWNKNALDIAGISDRKLSALVAPDYNRICSDAGLCAQLGISNNTPFFIGGSDGCLAMLGSFATAPGVMSLTIGTSGAVRVTRPAPVQNFKAMTFNYRLDEKTFVCGGPTNNGGVTLKWYAENFLGLKLTTTADYTQLLGTLAHTTPGGDGLVFLPYILGERSPVWHSDACGVFFGMRHFHEQAHFTRAVVEGITMALYHITSTMVEAGLQVDTIHVSGGFVHSPEWLQILANIFGKRVSLIHAEDASAMGAVFLALKSLGRIRQYQELNLKETGSFLPQPQYQATYRKHFERYLALYENTSHLMTRE